MKPTKNRVMCPDCGRPKMLFETEEEASTFLKFNEGEVNPDGTREMRVYLCPACCGYHISSHRYEGDGKSTDRLVNRYRRLKNGGSLKESIELFELMVSQHFTSKKEVRSWLKNQNQYSDTTKNMASARYYREGYRRGIIVSYSDEFIAPFKEE